MEKRRLSQEGLKLIACITMLLDHIGAAVIPQLGLRIIGRISFPIFCFLLAEGVYHTRNPKKYGLRLLIGALLAEIPFDLLFFAEPTLAHSSVMVTLLLGFCYGEAAKRVNKLGHKVLLLIPFAFVAELLGADYGAHGVAMIAVFLLTRNMQDKLPVQILLLGIICYLMGSSPVMIIDFSVPIEMFALLAMVPIALYGGRKLTGSAWAKWGFYLFYPVHLMVLWLIANT